MDSQHASVCCCQWFQPVVTCLRLRPCWCAKACAAAALTAALLALRSLGRCQRGAMSARGLSQVAAGDAAGRLPELCTVVYSTWCWKRFCLVMHHASTGETAVLIQKEAGHDQNGVTAAAAQQPTKAPTTHNTHRLQHSD